MTLFPGLKSSFIVHYLGSNHTLHPLDSILASTYKTLESDTESGSNKQIIVWFRLRISYFIISQLLCSATSKLKIHILDVYKILNLEVAIISCKHFLNQWGIYEDNQICCKTSLNPANMAHQDGFHSYTSTEECLEIRWK